MAFLKTADEVINDAAVELGLDEVTDPFASGDKSMVLLCRLLKSLGREIARERDWSILKKEGSFTLVTGTSTYALPTGFRSMVNQSQWNRTSRLPLGGGLSSQEWQFLSAVSPGLTMTVLFRPRDGLIEVFGGSSIPDGNQVYFEYISDNWVRTAAPVDTDEPSASTDTLLFDPHLLSRGLKMKFLQSKGFESTAAEDDYKRALEAAKSDDTVAPVLALGRTRSGLIGAVNLPVTGWGGGT
jgi:hypothetical protein